MTEVFYLLEIVFGVFGLIVATRWASSKDSVRMAFIYICCLPWLWSGYRERRRRDEEIRIILDDLKI